MSKIYLVLENLNIQARYKLLEESSTQSQQELALTNFFISETTDILKSGLLLEVQNQFINNLNIIIENEAPEDDNGNPILGLASLGVAGAIGAANYKNAKEGITSRYNQFKNSDTNASFRELRQDVKKGYSVASDKFKTIIKPKVAAGYNRAKESASNQYNKFKK